MYARHNLNRFLSAVLISALAFTASCKQNAPKKKKSSSTQPPYDPYANGGVDGTQANITIAQSGSPTMVRLSQVVNWTFTATSNNGTATISRIVVTSQPQPSSWRMVGTNQVTFTPMTQQELTGALTVYATSSNGGAEEQQSFYWTSDTQGGDMGACTQQLFSQAVLAWTNKTLDINSIPAVFASCSQILIGLFKK